jgi:hypothetical protein
MAKVNASLADVSTKYELAPPDTYRLKIDEIKDTVQGGRQNFNLKIVISEGEQQGKVIYHNIAMHTKQGEPNEAGARDMKRFAEAILGIDPDDDTYDWDSFDTDEILKGEFMGDVYIDNWTKDEGQPTEKKGQNNKLKSQTISPL